MRRIIEHSEFRSDYANAARHRKCDRDELDRVIRALAQGEPLLRRHRDHKLQGRYPPRKGFTDCRECHVGNDWLLVYRLPDDGALHLIRTGTHADLF